MLIASNILNANRAIGFGSFVGILIVYLEGLDVRHFLR